MPADVICLACRCWNAHTTWCPIQYMDPSKPTRAQQRYWNQLQNLMDQRKLLSKEIKKHGRTER